jgi:hypothetical protein
MGKQYNKKLVLISLIWVKENLTKNQKYCKLKFIQIFRKYKKIKLDFKNNNIFGAILGIKDKFLKLKESLLKSI